LERRHPDGNERAGRSNKVDKFQLLYKPNFYVAKTTFAVRMTAFQYEFKRTFTKMDRGVYRQGFGNGHGLLR
jgi:hypothetical protein